MKIKIIALLMLMAVLFSVPAFAQVTNFTPNTTLSAAVNGGAANNTWPLAATTGIVASGTGTNQATQLGGQFFCLADHEVVQVRAVNTTTSVITVLRGYGGTATPHASGTIVMCGTGGSFNVNNGTTSGFFLGTSVPAGACVAANNPALPVLSFGFSGTSWRLYNCNNGTWLQQNLPDDVPTTLTRLCTPRGIDGFSLITTFNTTSAFAFGTSATPVAGTQYYDTIEVPDSIKLTGISIANGSTVGTDKGMVALHRADGVVVAVSAVAGVTTVGVDTFQDFPFTTPYLTTGPARYWIDYQVNGTTTRYRAIPNALGGTAGLFTGILGSSFLGTFGTIQNLGGAIAAGANQATTALPTGLVTNVTPTACLY